MFVLNLHGILDLEFESHVVKKTIWLFIIALQFTEKEQTFYNTVSSVRMAFFSLCVIFLSLTVGVSMESTEQFILPTQYCYLRKPTLIYGTKKYRAYILSNNIDFAVNEAHKTTKHWDCAFTGELIPGDNGDKSIFCCLNYMYNKEFERLPANFPKIKNFDTRP